MVYESGCSLLWYVGLGLLFLIILYKNSENKPTNKTQRNENEPKFQHDIHYILGLYQHIGQDEFNLRNILHFPTVSFTPFGFSPLCDVAYSK